VGGGGPGHGEQRDTGGSQTQPGAETARVSHRDPGVYTLSGEGRGSGIGDMKRKVRWVQ
jgi:hypothetical protein